MRNEKYTSCLLPAETQSRLPSALLLFMICWIEGFG